MRKSFLACLLTAAFLLLVFPYRANAAEESPPDIAVSGGGPAAFSDFIAGGQEQKAELRDRLNEGIQTASQSGTIAVSSASAKPGDTVKLYVSISNNPGICSFILGFKYDTSSLTLKNVAFLPASLKTASGVFSSGEGSGNFFYKTKAVWLFNSNSAYNGDWLELTFDVKSTASDGDKSVEVDFRTGDISDINENSVSFIPKAGKITVSSETALDITNLVKAENATVTGKGVGGKAVITVKSADEAKYVCVVGYTTDNGATYHRLTAVKKSANTYEFTQTLAPDMKFIVMLKGDVTGDGDVGGKDVLRMKQITVGSGAAATAQQILAGDIINPQETAKAPNDNNLVTGKDVLKLKQVNVGNGTIAW